MNGPLTCVPKCLKNYIPFVKLSHGKDELAWASQFISYPSCFITQASLFYGMRYRLLSSVVERLSRTIEKLTRGREFNHLRRQQQYSPLQVFKIVIFTLSP